MKTIRVSVGITAHNESGTIGALLSDIKNQKQNGWEPDQVLVYDDGSTDGTSQRAKDAYKDVVVIRKSQRSGKTAGVRTLLAHNTGDIMILLDADIRIDGVDAFTRMVRVFAQNDSVMLAGGNVSPEPPATFIQRAIYATFRVFYESKKGFKNGNNIFGCVGSFMAVRAPFAREVRIPDVVSDDAFLYLACIDAGHEFRYVDSARVHYALARTLQDHFKQQFRGARALPVLLRGHHDELLAGELKRPLVPYASYVWKALKADPLATLFIIAVTLAMKPFIPFVSRTYKPAYPMAQSTKLGTV